MGIHSRLWITALMVLGLCLVLAPAALAGGGQDDFTIRLTISKTFAAPGDAITVSGSGAQPGEVVAVLIVPDPSSGANALASVEVTPDAGGNFSTSITVPATAATGRYAIRAEQPPGYGDFVDQFFWAGICVNQCTGETLGSMLPDTGGAVPGGAALSMLLSGLLVSGLVIRGVGRAARPS